MIARRNFLLRSLGLLATAALPVVARGERKRTHTAADSPDAPSKKNETARLRLWKATDAPEQTLAINLLLPGQSDPIVPPPLKVGSASYQFSDYVEVPTGTLTAEITAPGRPTLHLPLPLSVGGQSTLFVRLQDASLSAEWIDDFPAAGDTGCEFKAYSLLPTIGDIQISLGAILSAHLTTARSNLRLTGIKPAPYTMLVKGTIGSGKEFQLKIDVDFTQCRKATLLLLTDSYGRIQPKLDTTGTV